MSDWRTHQRYRKGELETLDKKWENYKKKRIFVGDAWNKALKKQEIDSLGDIWKAERVKPWKLTFGEVSTYVELSEKIIEYRRNVKREAARIRKMRSRDKMIALAKEGDKKAMKQIEAIKKSNIEGIYKKRKNKKQQSN